MKIYRISQSTQSTAQKAKFVKSVFEQLEKSLGVPTSHSRDGYILNKSIEKHDSTDILGESWTQVSHNMYNEGFRAERYFESEMVQNNYGRTITINTDYIDVQKCVKEIMSAIESFKNRV